jgi:dihydroneopterin aldolase
VGTLFIRSLPIDCVIGVHPFERSSRQRLIISLTLETDFTEAARSDDIDRAVDYTKLSEEIAAFTREGRFALIETLAERLADHLFVPPMRSLELEIIKPAALGTTREVGVCVRRTQEQQ